MLVGALVRRLWKETHVLEVVSFESQYRILNGQFFTFTYLLMFEKTENKQKEPGDGPFKNGSTNDDDADLAYLQPPLENGKRLVSPFMKH